MERVASTDRRPSTKRDAIANDDDSASEEPVKKSAKNEEKSTLNSSQSSSSSTSFSEDVEFQQNLARTYERFRAAREASYRAKKLLDAKDDAVDDSGMADKVSELSREIESLKTEVAELRSKEIAANNQKNELARENDSLKIEVAELRSKEIAANNQKNELSGKNHELNVEVNALKELNIKAEAVHDALVKVNDAREVYLAELEISTVHTNKLNEELSRKNTALNEELEAAKERADKEAEKNIVLKKALEESRTAETAAVNRELKMSRANAAMKDELKREKRKAAQDINDLTVNGLGLRKEADDVRKREKEAIDRETILKRELEETKKIAEESSIRDSARIKYLSHKLAQLEDTQKREQSPESMDEDQPIAVNKPVNKPLSTRIVEHLQQIQEVVNRTRTRGTHRVIVDDADRSVDSTADQAAVSKKREKKVTRDDADRSVDSTADQAVVSKKKEKKEKKTPAKLHERGDPINIFQLCRPNTSHSISLDSALRQIRDKFDEIGAKKIGECCKSMKSDKGRLKCSACGKRIKKHRVFDHILSSEHIDNVRSRDAAVSAAALQHWLREVQQAAAAAADDDEAAEAANDVSSGEL